MCLSRGGLRRKNTESRRAQGEEGKEKPEAHFKKMGRMELKVGDSFKCPEGHEATIVWISQDKKVVAVRCPQKHLGKVRKVADLTKPTLPYRH